MNIQMGFLAKNTKEKSKSKLKIKEKALVVKKNHTHSCAIGQTGCGKTTSYIYPNLDQRIQNGDGILFFDYKGKEHNAVKLIAKQNNRLDDVVEIGKDWGESINIIKYMSESNLEDFFKSLLGLADGKNDYWYTSGTNIAVSILSIVNQYKTFLEVIKEHPMADSLYESCSFPNIPVEKTILSVYRLSVSPNQLQEFYKNTSNLTKEIGSVISKVLYNEEFTLNSSDIEVKYDSVFKELYKLQEVIEKYLPTLESFNIEKRERGSTPNTITLTLNKTLGILANKEFLNDDKLDIAHALNKNKIIIINTSEFSEEMLSHFTFALFKELQKRIIFKSENSISVFIDEAQRIISQNYDLPIDVLREAKVEIFLAFQNNELMIEKLGKVKFDALYKNLAHRFIFKNNEKYTNTLKAFQYFDLSGSKKVKKRKSKPLFLKDGLLFNVELEYQKKLGLHERYGINDKKYEDMILLYDSHLFETNQVVLQDCFADHYLVKLERNINYTKLEDLISEICMDVESRRESDKFCGKIDESTDDFFKRMKEESVNRINEDNDFEHIHNQIMEKIDMEIDSVSKSRSKLGLNDLIKLKKRSI